MKPEDIKIGGYYQSDGGCVAFVKAITDTKSNAERDIIIEYDLFGRNGKKIYSSYSRCSISGFAGWATCRVKPNDDQKGSTEV
jgi:hypothetical protein